MSYAKNLLSRGEEVVFESRQHWLAVLGQTWLFVMGAILVLGLLTALAANFAPAVNEKINNGWPTLSLAVGALVLLLLISLLVRGAVGLGKLLLSNA